MQKKTRNKLLCLALSVLMMLGAVSPALGAEDEKAPASDSGESTYQRATLAELSATLNLSTYEEYLAKHADKPIGDDEIVIKAADYDKDLTTTKVSVENGVYGRDNVLLLPEQGKTVWSFEVKKAGMYSIKIDYAPTNDSKTNIERVLYINDVVPFSESRSLRLKKSWSFDYVKQEDGSFRFETDANGNEVRPDAKCLLQWESTPFIDPDMYYPDPFLYYFKEGTNTIALEYSRDTMYIGDITLYKYEALPKCEDVLKDYVAKGYTEGSAEIKIDGETPYQTSNYAIYPDYDRSSAISDPQDPLLIKRNVLGGENWQSVGDWVSYKFTVPTGGAGVYTIVPRYKQDIADGVFTSRAIKIDGEYPYEEIRGCRFDYSTNWLVEPVNAGGDPFVVYLSEGEHTIEFLATLGEFGNILAKVKDIADTLNDYYLKLIMLTGASPDEFRNYGFARIMPEVVSGFTVQADALRDVIEYVDTITGSTSSSNSVLETMITQLELMASDEDEIAGNIAKFSDAIASISSWVADREIQPLLLDYIMIQGASKELPQAEASGFQTLKYEFDQFIGSFYASYNTISSSDEDVVYEKNITAWTGAGRDQAQIIRALVDNGFCKKTGIGVTVNLVDMSALLPSILAGVGPDVSIDATGASTVIDYALRGACQPIDGFDDFDEVLKRFVPASMKPLRLYGHHYALPTTLNYPMMFIRDDILADLGFEIPQTWQDILDMVAVLQYNNMDVGIPKDYQMYIYQQENGNIWYEMDDWTDTRNGWKTMFDDNLTLSCFETMCEMFTQYSLPVAYSAETRFKNGTMPLIIADFTFYTTIVLFAPEIAGLWEMVPLPGTPASDGTINNTALCTTSGLIMLKGCRDKDSTWEFMKWMTDVDYQVDYQNEMIALLGESAKTGSANIEAMKQLPWSAKELSALTEQMKHLNAFPNYPGSYIIARYTDFAFQDAYNNGGDPVDKLLGYVNAINTEITRKRKEFGFPLYEIKDEATDAGSEE